MNKLYPQLASDASDAFSLNNKLLDLPQLY